MARNIFSIDVENEDQAIVIGQAIVSLSQKRRIGQIDRVTSHLSSSGVDLIQLIAAAHEEESLTICIKREARTPGTRFGQIKPVQFHSGLRIQFHNLVAAIGGQNEHAKGVRFHDLNVIRVGRIARHRQREIQDHGVDSRLATAVIETVVHRQVGRRGGTGVVRQDRSAGIVNADDRIDRSVNPREPVRKNFNRNHLPTGAVEGVHIDFARGTDLATDHRSSLDVQ